MSSSETWTWSGVGTGASEDAGVTVVSRGLEGGASASKLWPLSAAPYAGNASGSSSLLEDSSSDLRSSDRLLAGVDRTEEVRDELMEDRRSLRSEKEQLLLRSEKEPWLESKNEACEGEGRSGAWEDSISTGGAITSVIARIAGRLNGPRSPLLLSLSLVPCLPPQ